LAALSIPGDDIATVNRAKAAKQEESNEVARMELKDFISQTLIDITQGVVAASVEVEKLGGIVNPRPTQHVQTSRHRSGLNIVDVEFHVVISVSDDIKKAGGGGVAIGVVSFGGRGEATSTSGATTTLKFHVPLTLPTKEAPADGKE
jgi:hypothetical protein